MKNKQFLILQAIAIILVVVGHTGGITFLSLEDKFPIYSYHIALFVFISGYFFKAEYTKNIPLFIWHKTKRLLLPYLGWNLVYGIIYVLLTKYEVIHYTANSGVRILLDPNIFFMDSWRHGCQYNFNLATWFVIILFFTQMFYVFVRRIYELLKLKKEWILQLFFLFMGVFAIYHEHTHSDYWTVNTFSFLKICFFLPFYQFGYYYKSDLEKKDTLHNGWYFLILLVIQYDLFTRFPGKLGYNVNWFSFHDDVLFLPFVTSLVGILFWLRVSKNIYNYLGSNKLVEYIGSNTWSIMVHHLFVFFLINWLLSTFSHSFDHDAFRSNFWYRCASVPTWIYCLIAVLLPLLWQYYFDYFKAFVKKVYYKLKEH